VSECVYRFILNLNVDVFTIAFSGRNSRFDRSATRSGKRSFQTGADD
jgi:hypothetical protein